MKRIPLGLEYDEERVQYIRSKLKEPNRILHGDARQLDSYNFPPVNFSIASPPYMSKGDSENPFTAYTTRGKGYAGYLEDIRDIYKQLSEKMIPNARAVVEVANIKKGNSITTLAWDIAKEIAKTLQFEGEVVVDWDHYGYGYTHSYCLVFRQVA